MGLLGDSKDPMKLVEAKRIAETINSPGPKTPEQLAVINAIQEPGFIELSSAEKQKKLNDAVAGVSAARYAGHGTKPFLRNCRSGWKLTMLRLIRARPRKLRRRGITR